MKTQQITFTGLLVSALVSGGYLLYLASKLLLIPGSKFVVMGPYLSLVMVIALVRLDLRWTMTLVSLVFAVVISVFTPVMGLAILSAGVLSDLTGRLITRRQNPNRRACLVAALYPMWAFWLSLAISNFVTGNLLYGTVGVRLLLVGGAVTYVLGYLGAYLGLGALGAVLRIKTPKA